jgi:hypothetical protein
MIDAELEQARGLDEIPGGLARRYAMQADRDPRRPAAGCSSWCRALRIQAWREVNELPGRTLMRDGTWLT